MTLGLLGAGVRRGSWFQPRTAASLKEPRARGEMEEGVVPAQLWLATPCITEINLAQGFEVAFLRLVGHVFSLAW